MTIRVVREDFLRSLEYVFPGVSSRPTIEQATSFCFRGGFVHSFNQEVFCKCPTPLPLEWTFATAAKKLIEVIRKLPDEELDLQLDRHLLIKGVHVRAERAIEKEIVLPLGSIEQPGQWKPLHEDFCEAVKMVQSCTARESEEFSLTCLHIHPQWVEATDSFQICRCTLSTGFSGSILVRKEGIKHVTSSGMTEFSEGNNWVHFRNSRGLQISVVRYIDKYRDITAYLTAEGPKVALPKGLGEVLDMAKDFSSEHPDEDDMVFVKIADNEVTVRADGITGRFVGKKRFRYGGPRIDFAIAPGVLADVVKRFGEFQATPDRLRVSGDNMVYLASLMKKRETP